ncbi:MAG: glycosyltransferase [Propionicimonas sp.]|uniref:glycosyltransferase n=1 Tax=Propionicimonas sp. TaxID=1955623 RepID=UPI002B20F7E3|nr:glycosyltransferase [Propionicimonas sp.]MEA4945779.1 glycosyltransferase [Propionicimonas sp.]MEA5055053.1 glycosyltransferase [Propionicimonas sp.]
MERHPPRKGTVISTSTGRLRVAMFTDNYGPRASGLVRAVQELEHQVLAEGHEVLLVAPASAGTSPDAEDPWRSERRLASLPVPGVQLRLSLGRGFERALDELVADPPDVVHVHGLGPVGLLGMWVAEKADRPLVVTWHTDFEAYAEHFGPMLPALAGAYRVFFRHFDAGRDLARGIPGEGRSRSLADLLALAAALLTEADVVTTPSDKTADRVLSIAPDAHVQVVPNGCDPLPEQPALSRGTGPRLLYVGWVGAEKGIGLLLDAFDLVRQARPDAELVLVGPRNTGDLGLRRRLGRAIRAGGVHWVGEVPHDQLAAWYASADLFVFGSETDTQALVLHEAAHAGLPLVLVDPGLRLVAEDGVNARFARPEPSELAATVLDFLAALADPATAARASARSRELAAVHTGRHQAQVMLGIYQELAELRRGTGT